MARVRNNVVMHGTSGAIGKDVVLKVINGKNFATKFPDMSKVDYNDEQLECRNVFGNANKYASSVLKDPKKKGAYLAAGFSEEEVYAAARQHYQDLNGTKAAKLELTRKVENYLSSYDLTERQSVIIRHFIIEGRLTNRACRKLTGASKPSITRDLQQLVAKGIIRPLGIKGAGAFYELISIPGAE